MSLGIQSYCSFNSEGIYRNGKPILLNENLTFDEFALKTYKQFEIGYSKYHKMDNLCKLAILTSEFLLNKGQLLEDVSSDEIAIILGNNSSSIISDTAHQKSIDELPSPAVFVYTLPNIMIGEMCIKYKITGENSCFQMKEFDMFFLNKYVSHLFKKDNYKYCITGWVDFDVNDYQAYLFLITNTNSNTISKFDENIKNLI
ncbi:MAG: hypothetical protein OEW67_14175 [Cyclobacteriaceae bacterium]|nr:hypothetical protein [Cyclobacteriaceae bacterium]